MLIRTQLKSAILASVIASSVAFADEAKTDGGIEIYRSNDNRYWFSLHGVAKVDATFFIGDFENKRNELPSGTNVRAIETAFNGGIGEDFTYSIALSFESGVSVNDAFFTYHGIKNTQVSIGQVISPFCLENANSSKWVPFLERSLVVNTLRPCLGIGLNVSHWGDHYVVTFASTTPPHGTNKDATGITHRSDKLTNTARGVFIPIKTKGQVLQVGASGVYADNSPTFRDDTPNIDGRRFSTRPEARARNTPIYVNSGNSMGIENYHEWGLEAAGQFGPLLLQTEYLQANIHRQSNPNLAFYGWHAQVAYVLTGETRAYKETQASFGGVKPKCKYGAFEVAARHSMVNLNDEDIHGGKERNTAVSLGWYVNQNLKVLTNYIYASIDPTREIGARNPHPSKRHIHIIGARAQIVW